MNHNNYIVYIEPTTDEQTFNWFMLSEKGKFFYNNSILARWPFLPTKEKIVELLEKEAFDMDYAYHITVQTKNKINILESGEIIKKEVVI